MFGSFILRLSAQSFALIVSRNFDAGYREYGYNRADEQLTLLLQLYCCQLNLLFRLLHGPARGWLPRLQNPRRNQYKPW